jgi:hypothetical protein
VLVASNPGPAAAQASNCPSREAVAAAVGALLDRSRSPANVASLEKEIEVRDAGERYVVQIRGRRREFGDEARDCAKRIRIAAVFVALTVAPPDVALPELPAEPAPEPPPPLPQAPGPAAVAPEPRARSWWPEIDLGALVGMAPRRDASLFFMGAELRASFTSEHWGIALGASLPTANTLAFANARVRLARYPLDLAARLRIAGPAVMAVFDVGPTVALVQVRGIDLEGAQTLSRAEVGVRAAATLAAPGAFAPYLRVFSEFVPAPHELALEPRGPIGRLPGAWVGVAAGVTGKFP